MTKRVLILDTSVLCCWLSVPGKETAGPENDRWDDARVEALLERERAQGSTFVLPLASLIETGNHIAQAPHGRFERAQTLAQHLVDSTNALSPWAPFTAQAELWGAENLLELANTWPQLAVGHITIGDATIRRVAEYYAVAGFHVEILTSDQGLKAYEPLAPVAIPRRRK